MRDSELTMHEKIVLSGKFEQPDRITLRRIKKITEDMKSSCGCTAHDLFNTHRILFDAKLTQRRTTLPITWRIATSIGLNTSARASSTKSGESHLPNLGLHSRWSCSSSATRGGTRRTHQNAFLFAFPGFRTVTFLNLKVIIASRSRF